MRNEIKLGLYALFLAGACLFGILAVSSYRKAEAQPAEPLPSSAQTNSSEVITPAPEEGHRRSSGYGRMMIYGGIFFGSLLGLGLLLGHDVSQFVGNKVLKGLYNDEGEGIANPEYEQAEQEWANGHHLEAIRMMREYLNKHPREQHVALRIAEIYEKDLFNPLAAALEYEEVLKHKLPPERWGWAAIHLCNLYGKLNQHEKSVALLRRLALEYSETAAAEKARKRLDELGLPVEAEEPQPEAQAAEPPPAGPKLPPGFTLKKS